MKIFNPGGKWKVEGGNNLSPSRLPPSTKRSASFTLIEMIGVMAVMGILAAIVVPPLIQRLEDTQRVDEDAALEEIARALVKAIQVNGRFPDPNANPFSANGWVGMGSPHSVLGTDAFYYVFPGNQANFRKVYLDASAVQNLALPAAGWSASTFPSAVLMYIVSSSKPDLYTSSAANGANCQTAGNSYQATLLNDLKQWRKAYNATGKVTAPSTVASGWTDRGEYLHVKIVDLKEILTRVSLEDWHTPVTYYDVDNLNNLKPRSNPITSQGYAVSWSIQGNSFSFFVDSQPEKAPLAVFSNTSTPQRYDVFQISFIATNAQTNDFTKQIKLRARESAGYSLVPGANTNITVFDNPNSANSTSKEATNFFALRGSSLILYPSSASTANPQNYILNSENNRFIFKSGSWGPAD